MPVLLTKETFRDLISAATTSSINLFLNNLPKDLSQLEEYGMAGMHLTRLFRAIDAQLAATQDSVSDYDLCARTSIPADVTAYNFSYIFVWPELKGKQAKLYYVRNKTLEEITLTDLAGLEQHLRALGVKTSSHVGKKAVEHVVGELQDNVIQLTPQQVQDFIISRSSHTPTEIYAIGKANRALYENDNSKILGRCSSIQKLARKLEELSAVPVLSPEHRVLMNYYCTTANLLLSLTANISEKCGIIQSNFLEMQPLLDNIVPTPSGALNAWHILLIAAAGIAAATATGGLLAPVLIPAVTGFVGAGAGTATGVMVTSAAASGIGSGTSSLLASHVRNDSWGATGERLLRDVPRAMAYGLAGGLTGSAAGAVIMPALSGVAGEKGAAALTGAVAGGVTGLARGLDAARNTKNTYAAIATTLIHTGISAGVGAAGAALGTPQGLGSSSEEATIKADFVLNPPIKMMASFSTATPIPEHEEVSAAITDGVTTSAASASASAASASVSVSKTDEKTLIEQSKRLEERTRAFIEKYQRSDEELAILDRAYQKAAVALSTISTIQTKERKEIGYEEAYATLLAIKDKEPTEKEGSEGAAASGDGRLAATFYRLEGQATSSSTLDSLHHG